MPHLLAYDPRLWMPIGFEIWRAMLDPYGLVAPVTPQPSAPSAFDDGKD